MSKLRRALGFGGSLAALWLIVLGVSAIGSIWLPLSRSQDLSRIRLAPSLAHPFGTDSRGVDMVVRVVDGARYSLLVGIVAALIALAIGASIGLVSGYRRGRVDRAMVIVLDTFAAFPPLVAALAANLVWGQEVWKLIVVLGVLVFPAFARVTRAVTLPIAEREYVVAARMAGARHRRVMIRELIPNVAVPVLAYAFIAIGIIIGAEGALSFFGAGLPEGHPSWGKLIANGQEKINDAPHLTLVPAAALVLTVISLYAVAERWQRHWLTGGLVMRRSDRSRRTDRRADAARNVVVASTPGSPGARAGLVIDELHTWLQTPFGEVRAVTDVSLTVRPGELTALVGESGSGKTMLARSVLGLVSAPRVPGLPGRVRHGDVDLIGLDERSLRNVRGRRIAMVFQDPMTSLDPVQRIGRQLTEPMRHHLGLARHEARRRAIELLTAVGVAEPERRLRAYPNQLSGGLRQRVAIAIALSCDPDVLIADEPTSALDVTVQAQLLDLLDELRRERRLSVLLITHDLGIVAGRADRVAVMYAGRIVEQGPAAEVLTSPRMPYTRALLDAVPRLDRPSHTRLQAIGGAPPILPGYETGCAFQPRCPYATNQCATARPPLAGSDDIAQRNDRASACWHPLPSATVERSPV